jgi:hypothetical protein
MLIRIQLFTIMLIRIHGAKINADPHPGHKKLDFGMKNILCVGNTVCHKIFQRWYEIHFERLEIRFIC